MEKKRMLQLNELDEFRLQAYENNKMYKEKVKRWHDRGLVLKKFFQGNKFFYSTLVSVFFLES